jgi:hypothetical protein
MKYLRLLNILPVGLFIFALLALPALAATYTIDGDLSDWGVDLSKAYSDDSHYNPISDTNSYVGWKPTNSSVDWIVENNIGRQYTAGILFIGSTDLFVWAGSKYGTHKIKTGDKESIDDYVEPYIYCTDQKQNYIQPAGGEAYDIEALYFDDDSQYAYFAIVTSVPPVGTNGHLMGDIALDINDSNSKLSNGTTIPYEYGIKVIGNSKFPSGAVVYQPTWTTPASNEFPNDYPFTIVAGTVIGTPENSPIRIQYTTTNIPIDNIASNSVIELRIPKSKIGNPPVGQLSNIHLTIGCGNDLIELKPVKFKANIPEFPSIVLPVAAIMGIILILGRRKNE